MSIKNPTRKLFSLAAVLVATIGTATLSAHDQGVPIGAYAEIELPPGVALQKSPEQMPDFSVYYLKNGDKNLLGIDFLATNPIRTKQSCHRPQDLVAV
jgi:hypothetical protein